MTSIKHLVYTIVGFIALCILSYAVSAQQPLSMNDAVSLAVLHNRRDKSRPVRHRQRKATNTDRKKHDPSRYNCRRTGKPLFHHSVFFGLGNATTDSKIPYGKFGGKDLASALINLSQPILNASLKPARIQAELGERMSGLVLNAKENELSAIIKQTYLQMLVLKERIKLQNESLSRNQKALQDARSLLAQGRALRVDTLRAYTSVKNLEPDLLKLSYAIEVGRQQLRTLIGIDSLQEIVVSDSLSLPEVTSVPSEEEVYEIAKQKRSDLQSLSLQTEINQVGIQSASALKKPELNVVAQYLVQTQANNFNYFNAFYPSTPFVGLQLNIPVFNGNRNSSKVQQAKILKQQSVLESQNAYESLKTEVKQVVAGLHESIARIATSVNVKESAQLSYDITQYRYAKGVASRLELTDAELSLTTAQSNYLEAVYDYLSARIALEKTESLGTK